MAYTDEFLISELQRFYKENSRVPIYLDMTFKNGYPSGATYQNRFGSFNKGVEIAKLKLNRKHQMGTLDGTEICSYCRKRADEISNFTQWLYHNEIRYCQRHGGGGIQLDYVTKNLNKESSTGKCFISQRVVAKTLGLELKNDCNCSVNFGHPFDLYDENTYKYINVKDSKLYVSLSQNYRWKFSLSQKEIPDTYILIGFDENRKNILHVWITDPLDDLTYNEKTEKLLKLKSITNSYESLRKAKPWEVNAKPYDDMLHKMSEKRKETEGEECFLSSDDLGKSE